MNEEIYNKLEDLQLKAELSEKQLDKKDFILQTIFDLSKEIGELDNVHEVLEHLLMMVIGNFGALNGIALLVDTNRNKIESFVNRGMEETSVDILSKAIESGHFMEMQGATNIQILGEKNDVQQQDGKKDLDLLSSLGVNIWMQFEVNDNLSGGIGVGEKLLGTPYTEEDGELLSAMSTHGALAIRNIKNKHQREKEAALSKYHQATKESQYSQVIGKCKKMQKLLQEIEDIAKSDVPVTIIGEQGTGKELIARMIHADSKRTDFPVIEFTIPQERRSSKTRRECEAQIQTEERRSGNVDRRQRDIIECKLFGNEEVAFSPVADGNIGTIELVDKGTLIIKNIENMTSSAQKSFLNYLETGDFTKPGGADPIHSDARVVVTTKEIGIAQKQLDSKLFKLLTAHKLEVPSLSNRKKDIPFLMEHFVEKTTKNKHMPPKTFSKEAINKLLNYNYPGNVEELENTIEMAVELSGERTIIEEEEVFLGDVDVEDKIKFNLLSIHFIKWLCESKSIFLAGKIVVLIVFSSFVYFLLIQPDIFVHDKRLMLILAWQLTLPLLFVTYLFAARFACGICPMYTISKFISKYIGLNKPIPYFIKKQDFWIMGIGFMAILFIEEYTHMTQSITNTAYLILSVLFCAVIFDIIFEKSIWCRHLCPMGGLGRLFGMSAILELRANRHTCTTICTTHDCYKGTEKVDPCPMFLHLQFLQDNRDCKFCLNCIRNCKHDSPRLNLRIPGAEIVSLKEPSLSGPILSVAFSGFLIAEIIAKMGIIITGFPFMFSTSIFFALSLCLLINYITASITKSTIAEHFRYFGYTMLPLVLCSYIALKFTEVFGNAKGYLMILKIYKFNYNATFIAQSILVILGLFTSEYLIYKIIHNKIVENRQFQTFLIQGIFPILFAVLYISLFLQGAQTIVVSPEELFLFAKTFFLENLDIFK